MASQSYRRRFRPPYADIAGLRHQPPIRQLPLRHLRHWLPPSFVYDTIFCCREDIAEMSPVFTASRRRLYFQPLATLRLIIYAMLPATLLLLPPLRHGPLITPPRRHYAATLRHATLRLRHIRRAAITAIRYQSAAAPRH